ncbi:hypothetical protein [Acinetobacter pittii]|uniref:hypothetical protein n=1 Tax=Acinetobacter pittii TaxID=48296 RepID=UPI000837AEED|nr:hypothetical protein [Acinetobacter pittii]OCY90866.1 hypothetical protein BFR67_08345 [Acinetobacter pittii]
MGNFKFYAQIPEAAYRAQELFFQLGYVWHDTKCQTPMTFDKPCWYSSFEDGDLTCDKTDVNHAHVEVTLENLQEMVVLKRNDVSDANHRDNDGKALFITNENVMYYWGGDGWIKSAFNGSNSYGSYLKNCVKPINKHTVREFLDPERAYLYIALAEHEIKENMPGHGKWIEIPEGSELYAHWPSNGDKNFHSEKSYFQDGNWEICAWSVEKIKNGEAGARVLWNRNQNTENQADKGLLEQSKKFIKPDQLNRFQAAQAYLDGKPVQFMTANGDFIDISSNSTLGIFEEDGGYSFRIKPTILNLNIEVPAPFEPKVGDMYWFISPFYSTGYDHCKFSNDIADKLHIQYGAWRTEEEMKQVVAAWRKGIKELNNA